MTSTPRPAPVNEAAARVLRASLEGGRFHPTLLFHGPTGSGRRATALWLARLLNCEAGEDGRPCGTCGSCGKIGRGTHPDVRVLEPEGSFVTIEQARSVREEAAFRPFEGRARVYIFPAADRFGQESANALLKTLEEPAESTVIVLCAPAPETLLPTIRSRCRVVRFAPLPLGEAVRLHREALGVGEEEARWMALLGGGDASLFAGAEPGALLRESEEALALLEALAGIGGSPAAPLDWIEARAKKKGTGGTREEGAPGEEPPGPAGLLQDRMRLGLLLLETWLRDAMRAGLSGRADESAVDHRVGAIAARVPAGLLAEAVRRVEEARRDLERNVSRRIAAEAMVVDLRALLLPAR